MPSHRGRHRAESHRLLAGLAAVLVVAGISLYVHALTQWAHAPTWTAPDTSAYPGCIDPGCYAKGIGPVVTTTDLGPAARR